MEVSRTYVLVPLLVVAVFQVGTRVVQTQVVHRVHALLQVLELAPLQVPLLIGLVFDSMHEWAVPLVFVLELRRGEVSLLVIVGGRADASVDVLV